MDVAIRPSQATGALQLRQPGLNRWLRVPEEHEEIGRRVAVYARQIEETGQITWLPPRGEGQST